MENATDALKIAFAMFVFVIAITLTFSLVSQAKSTADVVLYHSDETNFYEYEYSKGEDSKNRIVSVAEVIPTLYRYYKESIGVTVNLKEDGKSYTFDLNNNETIIYETGNEKLTSEADREENLKRFIETKLPKKQVS